MHIAFLFLGFLLGIHTQTCCKDTSCSGFASKYSTGTTVTIAGLSCPGFDWTGQTTPNTAAYKCIKYNVPASPIISTSPTTILGVFNSKHGNGTVNTNPSKGIIGITVTGVPLYGNSDADNRDAYIFESMSFDKCRGHASPGANMDKNNGIYHFHNEPGAGCAYNDISGKHSPLFAVMFDGVPLFGVLGDNGAYPADLDECNGHTDLTYNFYHYHATPNLKYPYLMNCLKGCLNGTTAILNTDRIFPMQMNPDGTMTHKEITQAPNKPTIFECKPQAIQYDYKPLQTMLASITRSTGATTCVESSGESLRFSLMFLTTLMYFCF